jgi:predicted nucleic acid-binding protein
VKVGYLDTSCLVAIAFDEPGSRRLARRLLGYDELVSSNLLEAEFRAALHREGVGDGTGLLSGLAWILPDRPLSLDIQRALAVQYLRGADLWHLATALFLAETPSDVDFLTLDSDQAAAAAALGFPTPLDRTGGAGGSG